MGPEEMVRAIVSAAIAFIVPSALKQFWPEAEPTDSVPWFTWSVTGLVGGVLGGIASGALGPAGAGVGNWAAFGAAVGLLQWFALRGYCPVGVWFIVASSLGWTFFLLGGAWGWIVAGAAVGTLQPLSLAPWDGAVWWIPGNVIAWLLAGLIAPAASAPLMDDTPVLGWIVGSGVVGLVGAAILLVPLATLKARQRSTRQPA